MHGLFPAQRSAAQPPWDYHTNAPRESSDTQPDQAPAAGGLSAEPGGSSRRMGYRSESARNRGSGALRETGNGVYAGLAQRAPFQTTGCRSAQMKTVVLTLIGFYQACISPTLPSTCRYFPSCSSYAYEAVQKWGAWQGIRLALGRLLRCRPWGGHGFDPVPSRQADGA